MLFFLLYGLGVSVVTRVFVYALPDQRLFLGIGLLPVLITAVCCYIVLAEAVIFCRRMGYKGLSRENKAKNTAVKLFCITAVFALNSLYYCGVKAILC